MEAVRELRRRVTEQGFKRLRDIDQVAIDVPGARDRRRPHRLTGTEEMVAVARKHELVRYLQTGSGSRKVLFGTNWPMIAPEHALEGLDELQLRDKDAFLSGNAMRVFKM